MLSELWFSLWFCLLCGGVPLFFSSFLSIPDRRCPSPMGRMRQIPHCSLLFVSPWKEIQKKKNFNGVGPDGEKMELERSHSHPLWSDVLREGFGELVCACRGWQCLHECVMTVSGGKKKYMRERDSEREKCRGEGVQYCEAVLEGLWYIKGGVALCRVSGLFIYSKEAVSL